MTLTTSEFVPFLLLTALVFWALGRAYERRIAARYSRATELARAKYAPSSGRPSASRSSKE